MSNAAALVSRAIKWQQGGGKTSIDDLQAIQSVVVQQDAERAFALISDAAIERACKAHWPTWDRMRPDHQRKWREKMRVALTAFVA